MNNVATSVKTFQEEICTPELKKDSKSLRENIDMINFIKAKCLKAPASALWRP